MFLLLLLRFFESERGESPQLLDSEEREIETVSERKRCCTCYFFTSMVTTRNRVREGVISRKKISSFLLFLLSEIDGDCSRFVVVDVVVWSRGMF